ncbi:hypothetical protein BDV25DRAFT_159092 [Aspergillus avenaceus]|uniref:Uncharacterized protein n=1 Tax=Aspergillus avenaceus TaxID=36643 RepID=A0A5N6TNZ3_ASPAV|nr:hypothetical protein BDV25DRAFT_159092 [Aspergillus avenaceus]
MRAGQGGCIFVILRNAVSQSITKHKQWLAQRQPITIPSNCIPETLLDEMDNTSRIPWIFYGVHAACEHRFPCRGHSGNFS